MKMRYFMIEKDGEIFPIIFPDDAWTHENISEGLGTIVSSGYVEHRYRGVICYGEYIPLNMKSRGEIDAMLIEKHFGIVKDEIYGGIN